MSRFFENGELFQKHMMQNPPLPRVVQLELTSDCNLRCIFCPLQSEDRQRFANERRIELDELQTVLHPLLSNAYEVELTGFGEIFCHPHLIEILRYLKEQGLMVNATSNGMLWQPEQLHAIVAGQLIDVLCVSLDAGTPTTYAKLRAGGDFSRVIDNMRRLNEIKSESAASTPELHISFLSVKQNIDELPAAIELAGEVGASTFIVQGLYENETMRLQSTAYEQIEQEAFTRAAEKAKQTGIKLELWYQSQPTVSPDKVVKRVQVTGLAPGDRTMCKDCLFPWERVFVKSNMDVQVCATVWEKMIMGNLRKQTIEQIWHGEDYRELRKRLAGTHPPVECIACNTKPWKAPRTVEEMTSHIEMGDPLSHQLGQGFYNVEYCENGLPHRWTTSHADFFLRNDRHSFLDIEMYVHPLMKPTPISLSVNGLEIDRFRSEQITQTPMRFALPSFDEEILYIALSFAEPSSPAKVGDNPSRRPLGAMIVRAQTCGENSRLASSIRTGRNCDRHLARGFFPLEPSQKSKMRWTGDRASFVIAGGKGDHIEIELWAIGKPRKQKVSVLIDGKPAMTLETGEVYKPKRFLARIALPSSRRWHMVTLDCATVWAPGKEDTRHLGILFAGAKIVRGANRSWWRRS